MSSSVFFKFKSQKEPTRVEFDGTGISVFELKRDIIIKSGLGDGTDFDLAIYTEDGAEEYDDDTTVIPRSTTVVARRLPSIKPGAGRAARYVSGKMPASAKNNSRKEHVAKSATKAAASTAIAQMNNALTEEEKLAAMFQAQSEQWNAQQEQLSHQTPVYKPGAGKRPANVPDHDPPNGYICYRCGEKGHWIQLCPTNDNPEFDNRPRVKRTTGIPKSFLKTVDKATVLGQVGGDDDSKVPSGIMVNADGDFVIAQPDKATWEQFQARSKSSAAAQKVAVQGEKELQDRGLECPIDKRLFNEPMKTPCCEKTYCNECITNALIESDFVCPACQTEGVLLDNLKPDDDISAKIKAYLEEKDNKGKQGERADATNSAPSAAAKSTPPAEGQSPEGKSENKPPSNSPQPTSSSDNAPTKDATNSGINGEQPNPRKRPAEELAENPRIPRAPKAMQREQEAHQQQQQQQQQQMMQQMMGGMTPMGMGMPNMMPMGGMPMMNGMNGMGGMNGGGFMGMPGMPNMNMGMMNPMMNPMMGMPNFNNNNNMNGMNGMNGGGFPMGGGANGHANNNANGGGPGWGMNNGVGRMNGGGGGGGGMDMNGVNGGGFHHYNNNFQNHNNHGPPFRQFTNHPAGAEDDAYFRKPVNPHRHQNRGRRVRPSDYREL